MIVFQYSRQKEKDQPASHLWDLNYVPVKLQEDNHLFFETTATYSKKKSLVAPSLTYLEKDKSGSYKISYLFDTKQQADEWYKQFGLTANLNLPEGTVGVLSKVDKTIELQIFGGGKPTFRVTFKGPLGDLYSIAGLFAGVESPLNAIFGAVDFVSDLLYSIFSGVKDIIWPSKPPDEKALSHVRDGSASIGECVQVLRYERGEKDDRALSGSQLELLLLEDISGAIFGKKSKLTLDDWDNLLPILEKNSRFITSTNLAQIKQHVDVWRMIAIGEIKPLGELLTDKILPVAGTLFGVDQQKVKDTFTLTELEFGKPLNLRWHGWNVPATIGDTILGWFEGLWEFRQTKEADSFLGAIWGGIKDVVNGAISIPGKIIGTFLLIYKKSDRRKKQVEENIENAIEENERLIPRIRLGEKLSDKDMERVKKVYSNMLYLSQMLPFLKQSSLHEPEGMVQEHRKAHGMFYELLYARAMHIEVDATVADLESGKYKGEKMEKLRNAVKSSLKQAMIRLAQSYAYVEREMADINSFKKLPEHLKREANLQKLSTEELFAEIEGKKLDKDEKTDVDESWAWGRHLEDISAIVKDLKNGSEYAGYWRTAQEVLLSADLSKDEKDWGMTDEQQKAMEKISDLFYYANIYPVLRNYLASWAEKQPSKDALQLAEKLVTSANNYRSKREDDSFKRSLDWLAAVGTLFPASGRQKKIGSVVEQALEKQLKTMTKDAEDMKPGEKKSFISDLNFVALTFYKLQDAGAFSGDFSESFAQSLMDAAEKLYEIYKGAKTSDLTDASKPLLFWLYGNMSWVFSKLDEKDLKAIDNGMRIYAQSMK